MTCIICELNPMHNGHKYLIDKAADHGGVVLIMSGNFTQRGSVAVCDKYTRAKAAVESGADLVLELPYPWCSAGAADFAKAGVHIAKAVGADRLIFGSGSGNGELLRRAGECFAGKDGGDFDASFADAAKSDPTEGAAKLRTRILSEILTAEEAELLSNPNDILGIEYYRYSYKFSGPECVPVKRICGDGVASATKIREMIGRGNTSEAMEYIPEKAASVFEEAMTAGLMPSREQDLYDLERILLRMGCCDVENSAECAGGLGFRLRKSAGMSGDGGEMLRTCATKKYTDARVRRAALFCATGILRSHINELPLYTTVLGMSSVGKSILRHIKKSGNIEVLTKAADHVKLSSEAAEQYKRSAAADRLYTMLMPDPMQEEYFLTVTPYVSDNK